MKLLSLVLVLLSITACSPKAPKAPIISLTQLSAESWQAHYELPRQVRQVRFVRNAVLFRAALWQLDDPELEWVRLPGTDAAGRLDPDYAMTEAIQRRDGGSFDHFSATIPAVFETWPGEYPQNFSFTDGSAGFYTGHLVVELDDDSDASHTLRISPLADNHLVVRGRQTSKTTVVTDPGDDGIYVYFGNLSPVKTGNLIAVVDPALPAWLTATLSKHVSPSLTYFEERLGVPLDRPVSVYFSYLPSDDPAMHFKGSAFGDATFSLSIVGQGWDTAPPDLREAIPLHVVHEAAHLWNLTLSTGERQGSWMHEGGADWLSWLALSDSGYLNDTQLRTRLCAAYQNCIAELDNQTLAEVERIGQGQASYTCGAVLAAATDRAMQTAGVGDYLDFVSHMIQLEQPNTERRYHETVRQLTTKPFGTDIDGISTGYDLEQLGRYDPCTQ